MLTCPKQNIPGLSVRAGTEHTMQRHWGLLAQANFMTLNKVWHLVYKSESLFGRPEWLRKKIHVSLLSQI